jgi:hypothetical protein
MKISTITGLFLATALGGAVAAPGKPEPTGMQQGKAKAEQGQRQPSRRASKKLKLVSADGAKITVWKPDLSTIVLGKEHVMHGIITLPRTGVSNYHAIVAEKDWDDSKEAIVRYEYLRGRPSKNSPTILSAAQKTEFEIVPDPIPRGHYHYYSGQEWDFITRFKDKPVPNLPVVFETSNGTRIEATSDANGIVSILLPTDFPDLVPGKRERLSSDFMLSAEYKHDGMTYQSALSAEYQINRLNWRSVGWGSAVMIVGMVAGGFIGRSRKNKGADK